MTSPSPPHPPNGHHSSGGAATPNGYHPDPIVEDDLELTLGFPSFTNKPPIHHQSHHHHHPPPPAPAPPNLQPFFFHSLQANLPSPAAAQPPPPPPPPLVKEAPTSTSNPPRRHQPRNKQSRSTTSTTKEKSETIPPPYPWATDKRCGVHPINTLISNNHRSISGRVKCRKCEKSYDISFDLQTKFLEVSSYLAENKQKLCHRAPEIWMNPALPECAFCCQKNAVRPEIEGKKKSTNWLFLFLGQMLGCCTGEQLKYFCKHNGHHRTAAKDRLLYLAYLGMCKQLSPDAPYFDL